MENIYIICVDDQQEVLNTLEQDLTLFDEKFNVEVCDSGAEALELMNEIDEAGNFVALIITDQVMPEMSGVELLVEVQNDGRFNDTQKMLLTGQATHQDTIEAINLGGIGQYLAKPWEKEDLNDMVRKMLTKYVFARGIDHSLYQQWLDQQLVFEYLSKTT